MKTSYSSKAQLLWVIPALFLAGCQLPLDREQLLEVGDLRISEIQTANQGTWSDGDGRTPDWVELYNAGNSALDLSQWTLGKEPDPSGAWHLPSGTLAPGSYLLVAASGENRISSTGLPHTDFSLGADGSQVFLHHRGTLADRSLIPPLVSGESWVLLPSGWEISNRPTPGLGNLKANGDLPGKGDLTITEVQTTNSGLWLDDGGKSPDWAELQNTGTVPLDVSAWALGTKTGPVDSWPLGARTLAPGERMMVALSGEDRRFPTGDLHTDFTLDGEGDDLYLFHNFFLAQRVLIPALKDTESYILLDDGTWALTNRPSPGGENQKNLDTAAFSHPGGIQPGPVSLVLSGPGLIRYTLDGSQPHSGSPVYSHPLDLGPRNDGLPGGWSVTAAVETAGQLGPATCQTYLFGVDTYLPVLALTSPPENWEGSGKGLFDQADLYSTLEIPVSGEWFEGTGPAAYSFRAGARLFGAYSRNFPFKSLALQARSQYGDNRFRKDFFGVHNSRGRLLDEFESLVLRNSGNDWNSTLLRDTVMTSLLEGTPVDHQAYRFVLTFINGRYWGVYSLREKVNEEFLWSHHPETADSGLDILSNYGEINSGSDQEFNTLISRLEFLDLSQAENYQWASQVLDLENYIDYQIANIYFSNTDWPGNNIKYWKPRLPGGRWRWISFDTDFGLGHPQFSGQWNHETLDFALDDSASGWPNPPNATLIFRKLMDSPDFRTRFFERFETLLSTNFSTEKVLERINFQAGLIRREVLTHHGPRWEQAFRDNWTAPFHELRTAPEGWTAPPDGPEAYTVWDESVEHMRDFARRRPDELRRQIGEFTWGPLPVPQRGTGTGLKAEYYPQLNWDGSPLQPLLEGIPVVRTDGKVDFPWDQPQDPPLENPDGSPRKTDFGARWTGELESSFTGDVKITLTGDDGLRLWVALDGTLDTEAPLLEAWIGQGPTPYSVTLPLTAGQRYPIRVEYFQGGGGAMVRLAWKFQRLSEVIPTTQFYPAP